MSLTGSSSVVHVHMLIRGAHADHQVHLLVLGDTVTDEAEEFRLFLVDVQVIAKPDLARVHVHVDKESGRVFTHT